MKKTVSRTILTILIAITFVSFVEETRPRIFLIGDSTMANKKPEASPETGWGMALPRFIDATIFNHAVNGRSTKSFRTLGHWAKVEEQLKPGDWVFIQFGHNDQKVDDTVRYASPQAYRDNLIRYVKEIRNKRALPLLITPVMRRKFDDNGKFVDQHGEYPNIVRALSKELKVPMIDLHARSQEVITQHGVEGSRVMFLQLQKGVTPNYPEGKDDNTHFSPYGAVVIASLIASGIHDLNNDLSKYLKSSSFKGKYVYELPNISPVVFKKDTFNVKSFGARPDGLLKNTEVINKAITTCSEAGGGTVLIEKGLWLTGPVQLKNNVNLHLCEGALLQFSDNVDDYPLIKTNWEGLEAIRCQAPISGIDLVNVSITGAGVIDGAGGIWRAVKKSKLTEPEWSKLVASGGFVEKDTWYPTEKSLQGSKTKKPGVVSEGFDFENTKPIKDFLRPNMISLTNCRQALLEGVTFQNSPAWCLHPLMCEHLTLKNLTVRNPWNAQNGDGVDLESCKNVIIEGCTFDVGDDGICIKSGRDEEGRKRNKPTENVIVRNSTVFHGHGGFVIGSEMSGGARNLFVENCNFLGTDVGLRFKTARGRGGVVEKIYINGINMTNIAGEAIIFDMYYAGKDPVPLFADGVDMPVVQAMSVTEATPQFRLFSIDNVVCKGAETGILIKGLPEMSVKDISITNSTFQSNKGFVCMEGENILLENVRIDSKEKSVINLQDSRNITVRNLTFDNASTVFTIRGSKSKEIILQNTTIPTATKDVELGKEVPVNTFKRK